jgi:hypothetical protein
MVRQPAGERRISEKPRAIISGRSLFTTGALAVIRYAKIHGTKHRPWLAALLARRQTKVVAIALANKIARMAWAMMTKGEPHKEPVALATRRARYGSLSAGGAR